MAAVIPFTMYIYDTLQTMVHSRWIRVVSATSWRCDSPPRLVAGLAVTQRNASVLSRALEESSHEII